jgi:hypothetical protein
VLKALSQASSRLRNKLGESLPSVQKFDVPIGATTSSLEALENYSMGLTIEREKGRSGEHPVFQAGYWPGNSPVSGGASEVPAEFVASTRNGIGLGP